MVPNHLLNTVVRAMMEINASNHNRDEYLTTNVIWKKVRELLDDNRYRGEKEPDWLRNALKSLMLTGKVEVVFSVRSWETVWRLAR